MGKKRVVEKIIVFLSIWDEEIGPKIVDEHPKNNALDLEEISDQIFLSFQTIFGTGDLKFDRTNLVLPLKTHNKLAKILLDSVKNRKVRGGLQPFIAVILVPLIFPEGRLNVFNEIVENIVDNYQADKKITISDYYREIVDNTERLSRDMNSAGNAFFKQKKYEMALEYHEISVDLMEIAENRSGINEFSKDLDKTRKKRAAELISEGNKYRIEKNFEETERQYVQAIELVKEASEEGLINKYTKVLQKFYIEWAKQFAKEGDEYLKQREYKEAHKSYSQSMKLAKTAQNSKMVKKFEKKINKVPAIELPQKEKCPYCGKDFLQLSRHKCKKAPKNQ